MESKLKALKVVELKDILSKAQVTVVGKANKADLIAKILASPNALATLEEQAGRTPGTTASPTAPLDTPTAPVHDATNSLTSSKAIATPAVTSVPAPISPPKAKSAPSKACEKTDTADAPQPVEDPELEKRKARAARFGIPLVEPKVSKAAAAHLHKHSTSEVKPIDNPEKLDARSKRFGIKNSKTSESEPVRTGRGNKRAAPASEIVDPEEAERRKRRAERFGMAESAVKA
ncbi:hypothetical protein BC835DRAFT_1420448 [Cytidiella melzeri]|nr:hypothetical protein BC835DRAFT_1420448 [Cytidiella melzeri]